MKKKFICKGCGLCCKSIHLVEELSDYHNGNGICVNLDLKTLKCKIYEKRPTICNVEKSYDIYFSDKFSEEEYLKKNYEGCDFLMKKEGEKKENNTDKKKELGRVISNGINEEIIQRYGSAVKEHLVSYSGVDHETDKILKKGLKELSKSKVNPEYAKQNIKAQSGFSAEIKETARENASRIIKGDKTRVTRTDDIGRVNDPLYDHVVLDKNGKIINELSSQMKFVGKNPKKCLDMLLSKKYNKYMDNNCEMEIPSDYYGEVKKLLEVKIKKVENQIENLGENLEKINVLDSKREELDKLIKLDKNLRGSKVSNKEAIEARTNPKISVSKDILNVGHKAGVGAAKVSSIIGGGFSAVQNVYSVMQGEKKMTKAVCDVVVDTGKSAISGYTVGFSGTAVKGFMQNSSHQTIRALSKCGVPSFAINMALDSVSLLSKYMKGEINSFELIESLGEKGTGIITSSITASTGVAIGMSIGSVVPLVGTIIGGMVGGAAGSMLGYIINGTIYKESVTALKNRDASREHLREIEYINNICIEEEIRYQKEFKMFVEQNHKIKEDNINKLFADIGENVKSNNVNMYLENINNFAKTYNLILEFNSAEEIDEFMLDEKTIFKL